MATATEGSSRRGLLSILGATAVAGASGYLIQLAAARLLPDAHDYVSFSVFWSTLFLIGSAVGGVQQEIARATRPATRHVRTSTLGPFIATAVALAVMVSVVATLMVAPIAFAGSTMGMGSALAVGLAGYVLTAVVTGILYGVQRLRAVAALIVLDAVLRAVAVMTAFLVHAPPDVVAMAIALPFGLAVAALWLVIGRKVSRTFDLDVSPRRLAAGTAHTVVAATAMGVMVTGMPLLFRLALTDAAIGAVASLTLVVTLTRAPFIIPLMALQSYLTVSYRDSPEIARARVWRYLAIAAALATLAALVSWFVVPALIPVISGGQYQTSSLSAVVVVLSAVMVGCLCVTGPALLAQANHRVFTAGWVVAATLTILVLFFLPAEAEARAFTALLLGPVGGLLVHLVALRRVPSGLAPTATSAADGE
ncbi:hypothetical protein [Microbacterium paulum]